jgi:polysaccharide biosynthesis PFTS motif protein
MRPTYPGYKTQNWPEYLVWSQNQMDFLREQNKSVSPKFEVVGPIPFVDSDILLPNLPKNSIAVFDIPPQNIARLSKVGLYADYFSASNIVCFLENIHDSIKNNECCMVLKQKRFILPEGMDPIYMETIQKLSQSDNVVIIDPDIAAARLIDQVIGSISLPYTSTGLIAKSKKQPSIYFDPLGTLDPNRDFNDGVPLINDTNSLNNWIKVLHVKS